MIAVIVPLSTHLNEHRARAWHWTRQQYRTHHPEWQIVPGYCDGTWSKAVAVEDALTRTAANVLVVADADCWVDLDVDRVVSGELECVFPHRRVLRLAETATERVYRDGLPTTWPPRCDLAEADYDGKVGGGIVIVTRNLYDKAPLDRRFVGWGREDESWGRALLTMTRRRAHGDRPLWHLWHPPQARPNRKQGSEPTERLYERYLAAAGDVEQMTALIKEGRCHSAISSPAP